MRRFSLDKRTLSLDTHGSRIASRHCEHAMTRVQRPRFAATAADGTHCFRVPMRFAIGCSSPSAYGIRAKPANALLKRYPERRAVNRARAKVPDKTHDSCDQLFELSVAADQMCTWKSICRSRANASGSSPINIAHTPRSLPPRGRSGEHRRWRIEFRVRTAGSIRSRRHPSAPSDCS